MHVSIVEYSSHSNKTIHLLLVGGVEQSSHQNFSNVSPVLVAAVLLVTDELVSAQYHLSIQQ